MQNAQYITVLRIVFAEQKPTTKIYKVLKPPIATQIISASVHGIAWQHIWIVMHECAWMCMNMHDMNRLWIRPKGSKRCVCVLSPFGFEHLEDAHGVLQRSLRWVILYWLGKLGPSS